MNKKRLIIICGVILVLALSFFLPDVLKTDKNQTLPALSETESQESIPKEQEDTLSEYTEPEVKQEESEKKADEPEIKQEESEKKTDGTEQEIILQEQTDSKEIKKQPSCTLSVRCDAILDNMSQLAPEKVSLIPADGVILAECEVFFNDGESVFDCLSRELKKRNIHLEFVSDPVYNSVYIEGIANIYEKDCGSLSGWTYLVDGKSPNYGCSSYILTDGEKVEFIYSCGLG